MTGVSAIAGQIWSIPEVNEGPNSGTSMSAVLLVNGVTDLTLYAEGDETEFSQAFLDSLTPAQLTEKTIGNFDEGTRVTTYGDLKAYRDTENALSARIETIMQTGSNLAAGNFGQANNSDLEAAQVSFIAQDLRDNKPGALNAANNYLSEIQGGRDSLSGTPWQTVQAQWNSTTLYMQKNPHGNWGALDGASIALATLATSDVTESRAKNALNTFV